MPLDERFEHVEPIEAWQLRKLRPALIDLSGDLYCKHLNSSNNGSGLTPSLSASRAYETRLFFRIYALDSDLWGAFSKAE